MVEAPSEALVLFATPVAANSATLLTNAKLGENLIEVSYYFSEFKHASSKAAFDYPPTEFEKKAQSLVAEWLSSGLILSDDLVAKGKTILGKFPAVESALNQATTAVTTHAVMVDAKFHLRKNLEEVVLPKTQSLHSTALQYPLYKKASDIASVAIDRANTTLKTTYEAYDQKRRVREMNMPPVSPTAVVVD